MAQDLIDHLDRAAGGNVRIHFEPLGEALEFGEIWSDSGRLVHALASEPALPALLTPSSACLHFLLAALRSGRPLLSLPLPGRAAKPEDYLIQLRDICAAAGASNIYCDATHAGLLKFIDNVVPIPFGAVPNRSPVEVAPATLVQFTSGTSDVPKGVVLPPSRVAANVLAILDALEPERGDNVVSWLPWSHDMGLIGLLLAGIVGAGQVGSAALTYIPPEEFLKRPALWLQLISSRRGTITAAPDFGLRMATRISTAKLDLSTLRACIVGAESVRPSTLRAFEQRFQPVGFRSQAFCPAYGLAEATLAVTLVRPSEPWGTGRFDLDPVDLQPGSADALTLTSLGKPLPGFRVWTAHGGAPGRIWLDGPSVMERYFGTSGDSHVGPLETSDLGFIRDGELFVWGRTDDLLKIAGRTISALEVERAAVQIGGLRPTVTAFMSSAGLVIVGEPVGSPSPLDLESLLAEVREAVIRRTSVIPKSVAALERGFLPRTASGKTQRLRLAHLFDSGELPILHSIGGT